MLSTKTQTQIFITGATGYIGGTVLERLLHHRTASTSEVTVLVRSADKVSLFTSIGVKTLNGSLDDGAILERQASESDVVFACANADHVGACEAILRGLKKRHEATGTVPVLIHTASVLADRAGGMYAYDTIWDDARPDQLETLPDTQLHRNVDLLVLDADKEGYVRTYIILPSTIYGIATGHLVALGVQNARSKQIPILVEASVARKRAGMVGLGLNKWPNVHIDDVGDLYMVLYDAIINGQVGHGREGLYFAENGEHELVSISERIGEALVELGVCPADAKEPTSFDATDYAKPENRFLMFLGTNSRCKSSRARALGWKPRYTTEDMLNSVRGEVEWELKLKAA